MTSRIDMYRAMLTNLTTAQQCAVKCAYESGCATCRVRAPMNAAAALAQEVGETTIYNILSGVENNYNAWAWPQVSHELTNALNAAKSAAKAAESGAAADIQRAESHRSYAVSTGTDARIAAREQADAQIAAREAADAQARQVEEARLATLRKQESERLAAAAKVRAEDARRRGDAAAAARAAQEAARAEADAAAASIIIQQAPSQNWFMALPIEHKLAIAGMGFGGLLVLIFAMKS